MKVFLVFIISLLSFSAQAAEFGFQVGANIASAKTSPDVHPSAIPSFTMGVISVFPIAGKLSVQPELLYLRKGYQYDERIIETVHTHTLRYDYLSLPVHLKLKFSEQWLIRPFFLLGGEFSVLLAASDMKRTTQQTTFEDLRKSTRYYDLAASGGGGAEITLPSKANLFINGRYVYGLLNIEKRTNKFVRHCDIEILTGVSFWL